MMGGDPGLGKHLRSARRNKFWVRCGTSNADDVFVICADSAEQVLDRFPQLIIFEPQAAWESAHQGQLFREYDIVKDSIALQKLLSQQG